MKSFDRLFSQQSNQSIKTADQTSASPYSFAVFLLLSLVSFFVFFCDYLDGSGKDENVETIGAGGGGSEANLIVAIVKVDHLSLEFIQRIC